MQIVLEIKTTNRERGRQTKTGRQSETELVREDVINLLVFHILHLTLKLMSLLQLQLNV